ncbi:hypothetical protein IRL02_25180, partial [Vibrio vulnificus]|nr:hypothetical protein [Vibrio vulnificus]
MGAVHGPVADRARDEPGERAVAGLRGLALSFSAVLALPQRLNASRTSSSAPPGA